MKVLEDYQCEGQMSIFDVFSQDTWFGKTSPVRSVQTKEKTSGAYLKKFAELRIKPPQYLCLKKGNGVQAVVSWETGGALLGEFTISSFGDAPSVVVESRLSQILQDKPHKKYSLSARACQGILSRAERRGKELPEQLKIALMNQCLSKNEQVAEVGVKESLSNTNEQEHYQHSQTSSCLNSSGEEISGTLDASYYKGCGERSGVEREIVACLEGNGSRESHRGDGYKESNTMYTLNTVEQHAVCVGNGQLAQAKLSDKVGTLNCMHDQQAVMVFEPGSASRVGGHVYEDEISGSLRARPGDNQQAVVVKKEPIILQNNQNNASIDENGVCYTLPASAGMGGGYVPMITYGLDRASFNQGKNAQYDFSVEEEMAQTLVSKGPGGGNDTIGALCARDYKGVGNQYVNEGKCIVQHRTRNDTEN